MLTVMTCLAEVRSRMSTDNNEVPTGNDVNMSADSSKVLRGSDVNMSAEGKKVFSRCAVQDEC